jgi:sugar phosphate isomerase/epimerase
MTLGCLLAAFQDRPLGDALDLLVGWGLDSGELAAGGFAGDTHCPLTHLRESPDARHRLLDEFASRGLAISALNANGNPLHPDPRVGPPHRQDLLDAIDLAGKLGVKRVIAMPGMPAGPGDRYMNWAVAPLDSGMLDVRDHQWEQEMIPLWKEVASHAEAAEVRVCVEIHSHALVFNGPSMERLIDEVGSETIGVNMDPSHLWWQGMEPLVVTQRLGRYVHNVHAKDTRINQAAVAYAGFLDDRWRRPGEGDPQYSQGGPFLLDLPPENPPWEFASPGRGHDVEWWAEFTAILDATGNDAPISIELFDPDMTPIEGVPVAADVLREARARSPKYATA